jgi:hypothetical protein
MHAHSGAIKRGPLSLWQLLAHADIWDTSSNSTLQLLKGLTGRGLYFYAMLLQVSNPQGTLDASQAGALHTAAALFSLEAGGPQSGASLEGAPSPGFNRPSGPPPHSSIGRGIQNGR